MAGIHPGYTLDSAGMDLFHSFWPDFEFFGDQFPEWYYKYSANPPSSVSEIKTQLLSNYCLYNVKPNVNNIR